jgi:ribonuclease-3
VQAQKMIAPRYKTSATTGPDHAKEFEVEVEIGGKVAGRGRGTSKHLAEQDAATDALNKLGIG